MKYIAWDISAANKQYVLFLLSSIEEGAREGVLNLVLWVMQER